LQLLGAIALALPTAWHRERNSRIMGLRTFPLVSMGACAYILIGQSFAGAGDNEVMARIMQGLLAGIGFVGGGAIIKQDDRVLGTASAASIWVTGAVGAATGLGLWQLAIALSMLNFLIVWALSWLKLELREDD
jgi:putative Mg2+ transporter-C (MgtC) family protein